jgi:hypothetical protein
LFAGGLHPGTRSALVEDIQLITSLFERTMSNANQVVKVQPEELPLDIIELAQVLQHLPVEQRAAIEPVFARVVESTKRRRRILNLVQDALSQLRLDMKYLMFDLEATRRERDDFKRKAEEA